VRTTLLSKEETPNVSPLSSCHRSLADARQHVALAHAELQTSSPAADATVQTSPSEVAIEFTEGVEPKFSAIEVHLIDNLRRHGRVEEAAGRGELRPIEQHCFLDKALNLATNSMA